MQEKSEIFTFIAPAERLSLRGLYVAAMSRLYG
jgi:hypothetical protein